jgi:predicted transcriptional regulator
VLPRENYPDAYYRIREKLRHAREEAQLTQVEVARLHGKLQAFILKVGAGERHADFVELQFRQEKCWRECEGVEPTYPALHKV